MAEYIDLEVLTLGGIPAVLDIFDDKGVRVQGVGMSVQSPDGDVRRVRIMASEIEKL